METRFIKLYCKGEKENLSFRKATSKALCGLTFVPENMQPNGYPTSGTDKKNWSNDVIVTVLSYRKEQRAAKLL